MRVSFALSVLGLVGLIASSCSSRDSYRLGLVFTSDTKGYIEDCGCSSNKLGGLDRRTVAVDSLRRTIGNILAVETGNVHSIKSGTEPDEDGQFLVKLLDHQHYDATVLGALDMKLEPAALGGMVQTAQHPWIASNLVNPPAGVQEFLIQKVDGVKVGLFSWLDPGFRFNGLDSALVKDNLEEMTKELRGKVDLLVLVAHTDEQALDKLIARVPQVDIVLLGGAPNPLKREKVFGKTVVGAAGDRGRHVACFDLELDKSRKIVRSTYSVIDINMKYPQDPWVVAQVDSLKQVRADAKLARMETLRLKRLGELGKDAATHPGPAEGVSYVSETECRTCHTTISAAWRMTPHAQAYAQLYRDGQLDVPEREVRATTGWMERTGFISREETPTLLNVQCESCHGAGSAHVKSGGKALETLKKPAETCMACHNTGDGTGFDLQKALLAVHDTTTVTDQLKMPGGNPGLSPLLKKP
jgi:hypothetical protein